MSLRSPLARVSGLGSAKTGTGHWWMQRISAVALIPLCLWFVFSLPGIANAGYAEAVAWFHAPLPPVLMLCLVIALCYHALLGVQVVVEDYLHGEGLKIAVLITVKLLFSLVAIAGVLAILRITLASP